MGITDDPAENGGPYPQSLWGAGGIDHGGSSNRWKEEVEKAEIIPRTHPPFLFGKRSAFAVGKQKQRGDRGRRSLLTYLTDAVGKGFASLIQTMLAKFRRAAGTRSFRTEAGQRLSREWEASWKVWLASSRGGPDVPDGAGQRQDPCSDRHREWRGPVPQGRKSPLDI